MATLHATLSPNAINYITVGNKNTDRKIVVEYFALRGANYEGGRIVVLNDPALPEPRVDSSPSVCGLWSDSNPIGMDYNGDMIRLILTVDNADANNTAFDYILTKIKS